MAHTPHPRADIGVLTPAQRILAAVMGGEDPSPGGTAALARSGVTVQTLHLAAAATLQEQLREHNSDHAPRGRRSPAEDRRKVLHRAFEMAVGLADRYSGDAVCDAPVGTLEDPLDVEAAILVGSLQVRLLESVCRQIAVAAEYPKLSDDHGGNDTSLVVLARGGELAPGISLLANHCPVDRRSGGSGPWLHATSTVTVAGRRFDVVVDAGPDEMPVGRVARMAAPVTVTAEKGLWPESVVEDCLGICAAAVSEWVAAMPRYLNDDGDLVVAQVTPLRYSLVSPATAELTGSRGEAPTPIPLRAAPDEVQGPRSILADQLRYGGRVGDELPADTQLIPDVRIGELLPDATALLAAGPVGRIGRPVDVTVNLDVPEWMDSTALVEDLRAAGSAMVTEALVGWVDRDAVSGRRRRLSLRVRVSNGLVASTRGGQAVVIPAGTRITLLGVDHRRGHHLLLGVAASTD